MRRATLPMRAATSERLTSGRVAKSAGARAGSVRHWGAPQAGRMRQCVEAGGASVSISAQDLLNLARKKLLEISEPTRPE